MDAARKVAFGGSRRWRVATMDGGHKVVNRMSRRGSGITIKPAEIENMKIELRDMEAVAAKEGTQKSEMEVKRGQLDSSVAQAQQIDAKISAEITNVQRALKEAERMLKSLEVPDLTPEEKATLSDLQEKVDHLEKNRIKQSIKVEEASKAVQAVELKINTIGGPQRQALKAQAVDSHKEFQSLAQELDDKRVKIKYNEEKARKKELLIPDKQNDIADEKKVILELEAERVKTEEQALLVMEKLEEANKFLEDQKKAESKLAREAEELAERLKSASLKEVEYQNAAADFDAEIAKISQHVKAKVRSVERYKAQWDDLPVITPTRDKDDGSTSELEDPADDHQDSSNKERTHHGTADADVLQMEIAEELLDEINENDIEAELKLLAGTQMDNRPDMVAIQKYQQQRTKYNERYSDFSKARQERDAVLKECRRLHAARDTSFREGFNVIASSVREMYQMITTGGDAELELADGTSPFTAGISFSVRPPRKSWKQIQNLSGGEKTLSSLALVFALHHFKPTPVYFMDEIDAALDYRNVAIIAHYIEEKINAQFIIISLRHQMFERADRLVGVYKTMDVTKTVAVDPPPADDHQHAVKDKSGGVAKAEVVA